MITFISHESFPEDPYTKEIVCLSINPSFRFYYVRKAKKDGGLFWTSISASVICNGAKKHVKAIEFDSSFMQQDILSFLESRSWENKSANPSFGNHAGPFTAPAQPQYEQTSFLDSCPF